MKLKSLAKNKISISLFVDKIVELSKYLVDE